MQRIFLIDERINSSETDVAQRLAGETSDADVVMRLSAATSLVKALPQVRGAWRQKYQQPSRGLYIAARGTGSRLQLGSEGISATNINLLVSLRGFAGGRVVLWGCDAGAWAGVTPAPEEPLPADVPAEEVPQRSVPANTGHTFLRAIAQTLGLPVIANLHPQWTRHTWRLGGRHVIVQPGGAFTLSDAIE